MLQLVEQMPAMGTVVDLSLCRSINKINVHELKESYETKMKEKILTLLLQTGEHSYIFGVVRVHKTLFPRNNHKISSGNMLFGNWILTLLTITSLEL